MTRGGVLQGRLGLPPLEEPHRRDGHAERPALTVESGGSHLRDVTSW